VSTEERRDHLLASFDGTVPETAGAVVHAMTHHEDVGGVCRHNFADPNPVLWARTLATVAIDVTARNLDVRDGGPCGLREAALAG
jgi:hypothetical protein